MLSDHEERAFEELVESLDLNVSFRTRLRVRRDQRALQVWVFFLVICLGASVMTFTHSTLAASLFLAGAFACSVRGWSLVAKHRAR